VKKKKKKVVLLFLEQGETNAVEKKLFFENRKPNCGFGMKKTENRTDFQISKPLHH